jgi:hypothetical protein
VFAAGIPNNCRLPNFATTGAGFNERAITPRAGMLVEDIIATSIGTFTARGTLTRASEWVLQAVTFK